MAHDKAKNTAPKDMVNYLIELADKINKFKDNSHEDYQNIYNEVKQLRDNIEKKPEFSEFKNQPNSHGRILFILYTLLTTKQYSVSDQKENDESILAILVKADEMGHIGATNSLGKYYSDQKNLRKSIFYYKKAFDSDYSNYYQGDSVKKAASYNLGNYSIDLVEAMRIDKSNIVNCMRRTGKNAYRNGRNTKKLYDELYKLGDIVEKKDEFSEFKDTELHYDILTLLFHLFYTSKTEDGIATKEDEILNLINGVRRAASKGFKPAKEYLKIYEENTLKDSITELDDKVNYPNNSAEYPNIDQELQRLRNYIETEDTVKDCRNNPNYHGRLLYAMYKISQWTRLNQKNPKEYDDDSIAILVEANQMGHIGAMNSLGQHFEDKNNPQEAVYYYKKAIDTTHQEEFYIEDARKVASDNLNRFPINLVEAKYVTTQNILGCIHSTTAELRRKDTKNYRKIFTELTKLANKIDSKPEFAENFKHKPTHNVILSLIFDLVSDPATKEVISPTEEEMQLALTGLKKAANQGYEYAQEKLKKQGLWTEDDNLLDFSKEDARELNSSLEEARLITVPKEAQHK